MRQGFYFLSWLAFAGAGFPTMFPGEWECLLVLFAALVLRPLAFEALGMAEPSQGQAVGAFAFPALLGLAYLNNEKWWAVFAAAAYVIWAFWVLVLHVSGLLTAHFARAADLRNFENLPNLAQSAGALEAQDTNPDSLFSLEKLLPVFALGYWVTGALFALFFIADWQPLGFDSVIVSLTAAHFHVAGFVLTTLIFARFKFKNDAIGRWLGRAALAGMPSVALGITLTKMGFSPVVESFSALLFAGMAFGVAVEQSRLAFSGAARPLASWLFAASALCLLAGATLASLYGLRFQMPLAWINIPNLKIWHGSLNTLGFGWLGLLAWRGIGKLGN